MENICSHCNQPYQGDGVKFHDTPKSKKKYDAELFCSYECSAEHKVSLGRKNIEEKHGSTAEFNSGGLRRTLKSLRDQGISEDGIKEYKNSLLLQDVEKVCEHCQKSYTGDNIRIHPVLNKKKGYDASRFCSYECSRLNSAKLRKAKLNASDY